MRIEAHIICWNEERLLPYTIAHYQRFCSRIVVYDNYSTDKSPEIARANGCHVVEFGIKGKLDDQEYLKIKNNCWKGSQADYVIVCDMDEVLWHVTEEYMTMFEEAQSMGVNMFKTHGWNVYSHEELKGNITDIRRGVYAKGYSKSIIFDPKAFYEIRYNPGAHVCNPIPKGSMKSVDFGLFVLHYRNMCHFADLMKRHKDYAKRLSYLNRIKGWGAHYLWSEGKKRREYDENFDLSKHLDADEVQKFFIENPDNTNLKLQ
jgi:glycosyltransferase involved in cell wall biosynthesis